MAAVRIIATLTIDDGMSNTEKLPFYTNDEAYLNLLIRKEDFIITNKQYIESFPEKYNQFLKGHNHFIVEEVESAPLNIPDQDTWVIGDESLYRYFLPHTDVIYVTRIYPEKKYTSNTFFPYFKDDFEKIEEGKMKYNSQISFQHEIWKRKKISYLKPC